MFSLIVPAHNEAKTIRDTLTTLIGQEFDEPYEIIVACNGCTDDTAQIARDVAAQWQLIGKNRVETTIWETEKCGMSFGKNFGAENSRGDLLLFVDADTRLPSDALAVITRKIARFSSRRIIGTFAGKPDRGGVVVRACFLIANVFTKIKKVHAPGGVMLMNREVWRQCRFDENLPQGTSSDLIMRALRAGAEYLFFFAPAAITSIRRFEKTGIISQMLAWRKNHCDLRKNSRAKVLARDYENVR